MNKKFFAAFIAVVFSTFIGYNIYRTQSNKIQLSDLMLANIEALAEGSEYDYKNGVSQRITNTFQDNPIYTHNPDGQHIQETIIVYTEVTCLGQGILKCEYDFSADISTRNL